MVRKVALKKSTKRFGEKVRGAYDLYSNASEPQEGLVPLFNSPFYATPDTPADPFDCDRYPNSLYCGNDFWSRSPVDFGFNMVKGDCDLGIEFSPVLGFIGLPTFQIVYRNPSCRTEYEPKETPSNKDYSKKEAYPPNVCGGGNTLCVKYRAYVYSYHSDKMRRRNAPRPYPGFCWSEGTTTIKILGVEFPYKGNVKSRGYAAKVKITWQLNRKWKMNGFQFYETVGNSSLQTYLNGGYKCSDINNPYEEGTIWQYEETFVADHYDSYSYASIPTGATDEWSRFAFGTYEYTKSMLGDAYSSSSISYPAQYAGDVKDTYEIRETISLYCGNYQYKPPNNAPPPPHPRRRCCMSCCPENRADDALLKLILKKVIDLDKRVVDIDKFLGRERMPAKMPKRLTYPNGKGDEELKDLLDILGYQVRQVDRAVGHFPQKIKVADTNPGKEGNQSIELEIHSIADFAREILQLILDIEGDGDATNNMLVRCLYELGFIHQGAVQSAAMLDAIVDHLDFKQRWKKIKVPFAFDPYAGKWDKSGKGFQDQKNNGGKGAQTEKEIEDLMPKLLQNTDVEIRVLTNEDKRSLNDLLQSIKRDTSIAAAAVSEKMSGERFEELVEAARVLLQLQSAIDRKNMRQAITGGDLTTRPDKK